MKHVIITGGAGFIGSHLCDLFLEKGYAVTAIDNLSTGLVSNLDEARSKGGENFHFVEADICQALDWKRLPLLNRLGLDGILHFACPASPVDFDRIPFEILAVDSVGTMNMVDLAFEHRSRFVLASTSEIYGDPLEHPQKETYWGNVNTIGPRACYDETKRFAEAYVSAATRGAGTYKGQAFRALNGGMVRIFNTYGPRMRADDGRIVPEFCLQALKGQDFTVHGDGKQTRSFCYVDDLTRGILAYYESRLSEPVNLGNPGEYSILEFTEELRRIVASHASVRFLPGRPDDPRKRCPDISKAKALLQWQPHVNLSEGLKKTLEFFRT